jgi:hypothetical protein
MVKKQSKDYSKLSEGTKKRLTTFLKLAHKSGASFTDLRKLNDKDFAQTLGIIKGKRIKGNKFSNIESNRRLLSQAQKSKERREGSINRALVEYKDFGYRGKRLDQVEKELIKSSGNIFSAISYEVEKTYFSNVKDKDKRERKANKRTKKLLLISKEDRKNLERVDQDILSDFSP